MPTVSQKTSQTANFDRVARVYRWAEYLTMGPLLRRTREHFLPAVCGSRHALVLGDGDGRFASALLAHSPQMRATVIDSSAAMLALLRRRCQFAGDRVQTVQASLTALPPCLWQESPDLVVSHFVLDCLSQQQVDTLALCVGSAVQPGSLWLVSDFARPPHQPWTTLGTLLIRTLYLAFRLLTGLTVQRLPDFERSLSMAGFQRVRRWTTRRGLLLSELWRKSE